MIVKSLVYPIRCFALIFMGLLFGSNILSCGDGPIEDAQGFVANRAPIIDSITTDLPEGVELSNYMNILLTVKAHDPDGDEITYRFETDYGSFSASTETADGCEIALTTYNIKGGQDAIVRVTVADSQRASTSVDYSVGSGQIGPEISVISIQSPIPGYTQMISGDGHLVLQYAITSRGGHKLEVLDSADNLISGDSEMFFYDVAGTTVERTVYGSNYSGSSPYYCDAEGEFNVKITARDMQNQMAVLVLPLEVDLTPPEVNNNPAGGIYTSGQNVSISASDGGSGGVRIAYALGVEAVPDPDFSGSGTVVNGSSCIIGVGDGNDGIYQLKYRAMDRVGNTTPVISVSYTINTMPVNPPSVSVITPTNNKRPTWNWTSGGGGSGTFRYNLDSSDFNTGTNTVGTSLTPAGDLSDGSHTLYVWEKDVDDTWSSPSSAAVLIDSTPPSVYAGADRKYFGEITQTGTASDSGSGLKSCQWTKISGPGNITFGSPDGIVTTINADSPGEYEIRLTAEDNLGNVAYDTMQFIKIHEPGDIWEEYDVLGVNSWNSIALSDDGMRIAATMLVGRYIYISDDRGATWKAVSYGNDFHNSQEKSVAMSLDGQYVFSALRARWCIFSSSDFGNTFPNSSEVSSASKIVTSSSGQYVAVSSHGGKLYTSSDYGVSFSVMENSGLYNRGDLKSSADGSKIITVVGSSDPRKPLMSTDYGQNFSPLSGATVGYWGHVACSQDMQKIIIAQSGVGESTMLYYSTNYGGTFASLPANRSYWEGLAMSKDGSRAAALYKNGYVSTTENPTEPWETKAFSSQWKTIAMSPNGSWIAAADHEHMYLSSYPWSSWTRLPSAPFHRRWRGIASSSDGTRLAALVEKNIDPEKGYVYTSSDGGQTWQERTSSGDRSWRSIASSADGNRLVAVASNDYIYTSTDGGVNWLQRMSAGSRGWVSIASSADGTRIAAVVHYGSVFTSMDGGATWTERTSMGNKYWSSITSSADGTRFAAVSSSYIYTSTDGGATWVERTSAGSRDWSSIASSSDGTALVAVIENGSIYASTDGGATWAEKTSAGSRNWYAVASSSDGSIIAAVSGGIGDSGHVYVSLDGGETWIESSSELGAKAWIGIAMSADGLLIAAVGYYESRVFVSNADFY